MKRVTSSFIAILLGLAPAALAHPNQPQDQSQAQSQTWNEQNAWNDQTQQPQQQQQSQPQQQSKFQPGDDQEQEPAPDQQDQGWQEPPQQQNQQQNPQPPQQNQWQPPEQQNQWQQPQQNQWQQPEQQNQWQQPQQQTPAWQQPMPNAGWQDQSWNPPATTRPHLGILVEGMTPELRAYFGVPSDRGLLVARVEPNSAAARAGLQVGDVLMSVQGQRVNQASDVLATLAQQRRGDIIRLDVMRSGRRLTLATQLPPREQPYPQPQNFQPRS